MGWERKELAEKSGESVRKYLEGIMAGPEKTEKCVWSLKEENHYWKQRAPLLFCVDGISKSNGLDF